MGAAVREFWLCFFPLLVAVDAVGVLPIFMGLTEDVDARGRRQAIVQSFVTALVVSLAFVAAGKLILAFVGVTVADFLIAGGALLFALSLTDLLTVEKRRRRVDAASLGAVPLGVPLIVGPAVLTTTLVLLSEHGYGPTVPALLANIAIACGVFWLADPISRALGKAGSRTVSKLAALLLAAIAVRMVRRGIILALAAGSGLSP
jgi:multiple antibiotic resistance protein